MHHLQEQLKQGTALLPQVDKLPTNKITNVAVGQYMPV